MEGVANGLETADNMGSDNEKFGCLSSRSKTDCGWVYLRIFIEWQGKKHGYVGRSQEMDGNMRSPIRYMILRQGRPYFIYL